MAKGQKTGGRQKGTPNKTSQAAKDAIALAFTNLGGVDALVTWAQESETNKRAFYTQVWPKIVPLQLAGDNDNPITHRIELVGVAPK